MKERGTTEAPVEYECPPNDDVSYYLADEEQCDKYLECNIKGELRQHLCPDGFVFDIHQEKCDYPVKVNCTGRDLLREYRSFQQNIRLTSTFLQRSHSPR